jgi:mono/diheme cytochrome c family protein
LNSKNKIIKAGFTPIPMIKAFSKMVLFCGSGLLLLASCEDDHTRPKSEYMPDMYRSPSYETYSINPLFSDSLTARKPVAGTIPRGYTFFHYPPTLEGYEAAGRDLVNPLEKSQANIDEGKRLFSIYCMHCHGETGNGDGSLIATGKFPPPPSYYAGQSSRGGKMSALTDGKIYHTITYGVNLMGSHASQVNPAERWKIIQYIHVLQKGPEGFVADTAAAGASASAEPVADAKKK